MFTARSAVLAMAFLVPALSVGCASGGTSSGSDRGDPDLLTREQILAVEATNLYDVIRRLRPRWLQIRSARSFNMEVEIAVLQNDLYLGSSEVLKELGPELAHELRYMDGVRAVAAIP